MLPLMLLAVWLAIDSVRTMQSDIDQEAASLANNFATAIDHHLDARIAALGVLSVSPLLDDASRWKDLYQEAQGFYQSFGSHVILADVGMPMRMRFNTRVPFGSELPLLPQPRGYAAAPAAVETGQPAVGDVFLGPIAKEPLIAIAVPTLRAGKATFLLLATFETRHFQKRIDLVSIPDGWFLSLLDGSGEIIGRKVPSKPIAERDPAESVSFAVKSTLSPWSVVIDIPRDVYQAPLVSAAAALAAAILSATLIGFLGGKLAGRRLGRAVSSLTEAPVPGAPFSNICEIEVARHQLEEAAEMRASAEASLRESEERYRRIVETAGEGIWAMDGNQLTTFVNRQMADMLGYSPEEMIGQRLDAFTFPEDIEDHAAKMAVCRSGEGGVYERRLRRKDGWELWSIVSATAVKDDKGHFVGAFAMLTDITARKRAELKIKMERDFSDSVLNSLPGVLYCYDENLHFRRWNRNFEEVTGYSATEISRSSPLDFFSGADKLLLAERIQEVFVKGASEVEADFVTKDGRHIPYFFTGLTTEIDGRRHLIGVGIDVSERRRAQEDLVRYQRLLQGYAAHLQETIEGERTRIAREMHDDLGQRLSALKMDLGWVRRRLLPDQTDVAGKLNEMTALIAEGVQTVKSICADLRPGVLEDLGLEAALESSLTAFQERSGIVARLHSEIENLALDQNLSMAVYRIVQEALTNVARHAAASEVDVRLRHETGWLVLEVRDNGCGIPARVGTKPESFGIIGMQERVRSFGGRFELTGAAGQGTSLRAELPLPPGGPM